MTMILALQTTTVTSRAFGAELQDDLSSGAGASDRFDSTPSKCPNAVSLRVGDKVSDCDRVGLRTDYAKRLKVELIEGEFNKKIIAEQGKIIELKDLAIKNANAQAESFKLEAERERKNSQNDRLSARLNLWVGIAAGAFSILAGAWAIEKVGGR